MVPFRQLSNRTRCNLRGSRFMTRDSLIPIIVFETFVVFGQLSSLVISEICLCLPSAKTERIRSLMSARLPYRSGFSDFMYRAFVLVRAVQA